MLLSGIDGHAVVWGPSDDVPRRIPSPLNLLGCGYDPVQRLQTVYDGHCQFFLNEVNVRKRSNNFSHISAEVGSLGRILVDGWLFYGNCWERMQLLYARAQRLDEDCSGWRGPRIHFVAVFPILGPHMWTRFLLLIVLLGGAIPVDAQAGPETVSGAENVQTNLDYVWTVLAAMLVFFMQAGFALLETGLTRAKNAINIIMKNVTDASVGVFVFFAVGFGVMFGSSLNGLMGTTGFFLHGLVEQHGTWTYAFFFFQAVFAATAATIVSGAVAERTRFAAYLVFSVIVTGLIYPIFGAWAWGGLLDGGGWLERLGFIDFAGSTVVHSVGGWAALAGTIVVGPRRDKYDEDGAPRDIPGHSLPLAALGVFILWLGWFGFNAGSTTAGTPAIARIVVNTVLASAAGAMGALLATWIRTGTPTPMMALNGVLGGLVSITAGCATLAPGGAILTGAVAGMVLVYATAALDWMIDDPVGAVAVHGVCGAWGTMAAGLFDVSGLQVQQLGVQFLGVTAAFLWAFPVSYVAFQFADRLVGLRLSEAAEEKGLDRHEHDAAAYPGFAGDGARGALRTHTEGIRREEVFQDDSGSRNPLALDQGSLLNDQFRIGRVLGIGGFGITYLAFDEVLEMGVAVKEYLPSEMAARKTDGHTVQPLSTTGAEMDEADFEYGLERFLQEARTLARFERHPNIVRVRTFFRANGTAYLVMNFYKGRTLAEYLALNNGFIPEDEVLLIMQQVFDGLAVVHEADVLHRDIDPSNVYLANDGTVVLLDFGAARAAMGERTHNKSAVMKEGYAPYEQYRTEGTQGPWTDVYACAAMLYRCLTGYKPPRPPGASWTTRWCRPMNWCLRSRRRPPRPFGRAWRCNRTSVRSRWTRWRRCCPIRRRTARRAGLGRGAPWTYRRRRRTRRPSYGCGRVIPAGSTWMGTPPARLSRASRTRSASSRAPIACGRCGRTRPPNGA